LGFKLLRKLRDEFRAERIGAFNDEFFGARVDGNKRERECDKEVSDFHRMRCLMVRLVGG
jgi:hypothetical protein